MKVGPTALTWLLQYRVEWLRDDLVAGITLAAYLIPASLGDASLANLPPEAGLYACMFAGLVFWSFCSSRQTAITVTSAISLLVGASLGELAGGDSLRFAGLAACVALLTGAMYFVGWLTKAGVVVYFISETVLVGFKSGIALFLASAQLPKLFGFKGSHGDFWERSSHFLTHLHETNPTSLLLGLGALLFLILGKLLFKNKPVALVAVVASILVASSVDLSRHGVAMLGEVPQGLPSIGFPRVQFSDVNELIPLAMACFLLGAVETAAIGRTFALKHGYRFDPNQEFLALASANVAAGLGQGFPVSGGMSQSLVNESGGARTPLSGLIAALATLVVAVSLSGMLRYLPQPVLAAVVLMAVAGLFKVSALKRLWQFSHAEFAIAMIALAGVLGSGILRGALIGAAVSLILLLRRGSRPHTAELGRAAGTEHFADLMRHPENERVPGVFIFRCDGPLLFFNADYVRDRFVQSLILRGPETELAIFYLGTTPTIDLAGAEMLQDLHRTLAERGIAFRLAEAHGGVRDVLRRAGYFEHGGTHEAHLTVSSLVQCTRKID